MKIRCTRVADGETNCFTQGKVYEIVPDGDTEGFCFLDDVGQWFLNTDTIEELNSWANSTFVPVSA